MKRIMCVLLCLTLLGACSVTEPVPAVTEPLPAVENGAAVTAALAARDGYHIRAAVLHGTEGGCWRETLDYLSQPFLVNMEAEAVDVTADLTGVDVLYLDESLLSEPGWAETAQRIIDYTETGGAVLVPNAFYGAFPADYLGAAGFEPLTLPESLVLPTGLRDLADLQELIADFHGLYKGFTDYEALKGMDYGMAMVPDTAVPLVLSGDGELALYAVNRWGGGAVLFTSPLLPNGFVQGDLSMEPLNRRSLLRWPPVTSSFSANGRPMSPNCVMVSRWTVYSAVTVPLRCAGPSIMRKSPRMKTIPCGSFPRWPRQRDRFRLWW